MPRVDSKAPTVPQPFDLSTERRAAEFGQHTGSHAPVLDAKPVRDFGAQASSGRLTRSGTQDTAARTEPPVLATRG